MSPRPEWDAILQTMAVELQMADWHWLDAIINEESAGWNPLASNPHSSAKGLIQFMDSTAQQMGFASSQDLINQYPDVPSQLQGPVMQYFSQIHNPPYPTNISVYMCVLQPTLRNATLDTALSATVQSANPFKTVGDYVSFVETKAMEAGIINTAKATALPLLVIGAAVWWFLIRKPKRKNCQKRMPLRSNPALTSTRTDYRPWAKSPPRLTPVSQAKKKQLDKIAAQYSSWNYEHVADRHPGWWDAAKDAYEKGLVGDLTPLQYDYFQRALAKSTGWQSG